MAGKSGRTISNVPQRSARKTLLSWEGMLVIVFILIIFFCMIISDYFTVGNVLREMPKYLTEMFLLLGMAYILILGEIDISVGSTVCLSATLSCMICNAGAPFGVSFIIALLIGAGCGLVNGFILTRFPELPPMILTLATQIIFRGIAELVLGSGGTVALSNTKAFSVLSAKLGQVPLIFFLVLILAVVFGVVLAKTTFGRSIYAIGSNRIAAYYAGIAVQRVRLMLYTLLGLMAGLAGAFMVSIAFSANTTTGDGFEMDAIAMAVFGGISTAGGKGGIFGAVVSGFIIVLLRIGLGQVNMNSQLILLIIGVLLIMAVLIPNIGGTIRGNKNKEAAK